MVRVSWRFLVLFLVGCGGISFPTAEPPEGRIALFTADAQGEPLPIPLVRARVRDRPETLMVDSGASQHFLLGATAWIHDVDSELFHTVGTDTHGETFGVRLAEQGVLRIDRYVAPFVFVFESPALHRLGVRGGVSPQLLAGEGRATVLDARRGFLEVRTADALRGWERAIDALPCLAGDDPRDGFRFVLPVRIDGVETPMMIDTGAEGIVVYAGTPAAARLEARMRELDVRDAVGEAIGPLEPDPADGPTDVNGADVNGADSGAGDSTDGAEGIGLVTIAGAASVASARVLPRIEVELGGARLHLEVGVVEHAERGDDDACHELGIVGFRALRHCVLVLRREGAALRCDPREPSMRRAPPAEAPHPVRVVSVEATAGCGFDSAALTPTVDEGGIPELGSELDAYARLQPSVDAHAERIERACRDAGYLEARVRRPILRRGPDGVRVRFEVEEGRTRRVRHFAIELEVVGGETRRFDASAVPWLRSRTGRVFVGRDFEADDYGALGARLRDPRHPIRPRGGRGGRARSRAHLSPRAAGRTRAARAPDRAARALTGG